MPFISDHEYKALLKRIESLEKTVSGVKNSPIIVSSPSKRLILNDHLDVQKLNKAINVLQKSILLIVNASEGTFNITEDVRFRKKNNEIILENYNTELQKWVNTGTSFIL